MRLHYIMVLDMTVPNGRDLFTDSVKFERPPSRVCRPLRHKHCHVDDKFVNFQISTKLIN